MKPLKVDTVYIMMKEVEYHYTILDQDAKRTKRILYAVGIVSTVHCILFLTLFIMMCVYAHDVHGLIKDIHATIHDVHAYSSSLYPRAIHTIDTLESSIDELHAFERAYNITSFVEWMRICLSDTSNIHT